ncbi:hypothetical protein SKAU_G00019860 [Synaphobranchus kaupii]|uniref:Uncharacterized protein n=1 Tax=Synaphobranchus kaupii TaxID=118154 RepID=A0A9Q1JD06_SYNKA|nr:hypothetical protein SKAU_G00019860 [Synaphobranchus kaupii]
MDLFDRGKVRKRSQDQRERKIRILKLKESVAEYQDRVRGKMTNAGTDDLWKTLKRVLVEEAAENSIKKKKAAFKEWQGDRENQEKRDRYKAAKKEARRSVAEAKEQATKEWYEEMETPEGEKRVYKVVKQRERARRDIPIMKVIKDREGNILVEEEMVRARWKEYCKMLLNESSGTIQSNHRNDQSTQTPGSLLVPLDPREHLEYARRLGGKVYWLQSTNKKEMCSIAGTTGESNSWSRC